MNRFSDGELRYIAVMFDAHHQILAGKEYGGTREVLVHDKVVTSCPCACATLWRKVDDEIERRKKEPIA